MEERLWEIYQTLKNPSWSHKTKESGLPVKIYLLLPNNPQTNRQIKSNYIELSFDFVFENNK